MYIKILKKMLSILCVAAMSFSITPSVGAIKTSGGTKKIETNVGDIVEKLNTKVEKLLAKIKNKNIYDRTASKWNEFMLELKNLSSSKFNTNSVNSELKKLDDFVENLLSIDSQAAEYHILNMFPQKMRSALCEAKRTQTVLPVSNRTNPQAQDGGKKMQTVAPVSNKTNPQAQDGGKKMQTVAPVSNKTNPQAQDGGKKMQTVVPVSNKTNPQAQDGGKKAQSKNALIKEAKDALNNCSETLSSSMKLFENCDKNHVKQALSLASQLFSDAKQNQTDNAMMTKCVKAWKALNEINGTKVKIMNYCKVLQNKSLEDECGDILFKCFENFKNNGEFNLSNIKYINSKLNKAMRPMINQKILSINNLQAFADSNLQTKWKNEIQAGRQSGPSCWLFAATNARNWFKIKNGESRIYGFENVRNEYVKNKGNAQDLKSDQDYEPIVKYLNNCKFSTYIVTSDIGNNDKEAQETNRLLSEALLKKHFSEDQSAVVVNRPGHWVAIAGINTQTKKALIVDSLNETPYWTDLSSLCDSISNIRDRKNPTCNGLSMIFVKDDLKSRSNSAAFQNEDMSDWLHIFDDAIKAANGEF